MAEVIPFALAEELPAPAPDPGPRPLRRLLVGLAVAEGLVSLLHAILAWRHDSNLDHVAGAWTAMAVDLSGGQFYRPITSALGYGGTRNFPLFFVLHAGLIALGLDPLRAGYLLDAASMLALVAGLYVLLRRWGVAPWLCACAAATALASGAAQLALTTIRGDGLAAALSLWGVVACAVAQPRRRELFASALLFTLAFAAKLTALSGLAAVVLWLATTRKWREAAWLALASAAGMALVLGTMYLASDGRVFGILRICASGGATPQTALKGASSLVKVCLTEDAGGLPLLALAGAALLAFPRTGRRQLAPILFVVTLAVTSVVFGSPGTSKNHLLELHVAGVALLMVFISDAAGRGIFPRAALAVALLFTLRAEVMSIGALVPRAERMRQALAVVGPHSRPILSEHPALPLLDGDKPVVLDPFMLRLARAADPAVTKRLWEELDRQRFAAVILFSDPRTAFGREFLQNLHFGEGFVEHVEANYRRAAQLDDLIVYLPTPR